MADQNVALKIDNVSKTFKLPHEKQTSLKGSFLQSFKGNSYEVQTAFKDVSFEIKKGEFFGIVGRNGSGKSTLLKCIAGVYTPNRGHITVNGSLVPFIELGVGFNPELSGRDNVFLNGALLGFSRKEMEAMYDDIVEFAELTDFMDQMLKNYSSGMQVRLAFSIAIRAQGDILLLDEVLAVGDASFQQKCFDYFATLKRDKRTIILVSHSMPMIERFCDRALLLEQGEVQAIGTSSQIAGIYEDMIMKEEVEKREKKAEKDTTEKPVAKIDASVEVRVDSKLTKNVETHENMKIIVRQKSDKDVKEAFFGLNVRNTEGLLVMVFDSRENIDNYSLKAGEEKVIAIDVQNVLTNGVYYFTLGVSDAVDTAQTKLFKKRNLASFSVFGVRKNVEGIVQAPIKMYVDSENK